jgi:hypothetical protein
MDNLIFIAVVCWFVWKAIKSAKEKARQSSQQQTPPQQRRQAPFAQGRPHGHEPPPAPASIQRQKPFAQGQPHRHEAPREQASLPSRQSPGYKGEQPTSLGDALSDMERLFAEAMERKRGIEQAPDRGRPQVARPMPAQQRPEPEADPWIPPKPEPEADPWIPSQPDPRRKVRVERQQVARPRKREAAKPAPKTAKPPPAPAKVRKREKQRLRVIQRKPAGTIPILGTLNMNDVRKGIILAEILGPPKALKDIDSHVI